jgi:hypothetical protein
MERRGRIGASPLVYPPPAVAVDEPPRYTEESHRAKMKVAGQPEADTERHNSLVR